MSILYSPEQFSMLKDTITAQEGTSVLVAKVRFADKTASFKKSSTGVYVAPSSWQAGFPDWRGSGKGTQVVWECPDISQCSWQLHELFHPLAKISLSNSI